MNTPFNLNIVRGIAMTQFRPMEANDFNAFAGAADGSVIGFTDGRNECLILGLMGLPGLQGSGKTLMTDENSIAIVASPGLPDEPSRIEVYLMDEDGDTTTVILQMEVL